jgi:hypothetical protein
MQTNSKITNLINKAHAYILFKYALYIIWKHGEIEEYSLSFKKSKWVIRKFKELIKWIVNKMIIRAIFFIFIVFTGIVLVGVFGWIYLHNSTSAYNFLTLLFHTMSCFPTSEIQNSLFEGSSNIFKDCNYEGYELFETKFSNAYNNYNYFEIQKFLKKKNNIIVYYYHKHQ